MLGHVLGSGEVESGVAIQLRYHRRVYILVVLGIFMSRAAAFLRLFGPLKMCLVPWGCLAKSRVKCLVVEAQEPYHPVEGVSSQSSSSPVGGIFSLKYMQEARNHCSTAPYFTRQVGFGPLRPTLGMVIRKSLLQIAKHMVENHCCSKSIIVFGTFISQMSFLHRRLVDTQLQQHEQADTYKATLEQFIQDAHGI